MKAVYVGKTVAIDAGKKLVEKAAKRLTAAKSQVANVMVSQINSVLVPPEEITKKLDDVIAKYFDMNAMNAINLNKFIDVQSIKCTNTSKQLQFKIS